MAAAKQGLNTIMPTELVEPSLAIIDMTTLVATDYPSSERGKEKSCEGISPDYCIPEFQDRLKVYGENVGIRVTAEYLSVSSGRFSQLFARTCTRTGGMICRNHRQLRDLFQCDACDDD